jgi:signal transduction histidine kinase
MLKDFYCRIQSIQKHHSKLEQANLDPTLLHQILQNLLSNAIKYNDKPEGIIYVRVFKDLEDAVIEVQDNGPGIPHHYKDRIFIMFQTLQAADRFGVKGTGIGLNTVKKLVELMHGSIEVDTEIAEGTIFRIRLPLV